MQLLVCIAYIYCKIQQLQALNPEVTKKLSQIAIQQLEAELSTLVSEGVQSSADSTHYAASGEGSADGIAVPSAAPASSNEGTVGGTPDATSVPVDGDRSGGSGVMSGVSFSSSSTINSTGTVDGNEYASELLYILRLAKSVTI
jgi:hypothetical protein